MRDEGRKDELLFILHPSYFILEFCRTAYINLRFSLHDSALVLLVVAGPEVNRREVPPLKTIRLF